MRPPASGPSAILEALRARPDEALSGEALSSQLGVSRAQIWKHVGTLRRRGYAIEGARGGGYQLRQVPDRLYPEELQHRLRTRWLGHAIEHFEQTDSTNRVAFDRGRAGAAAGTVVVAEAQSAGRGRLGRTFYSPPHANFYGSVVLRPTGSIAATPTLILAAAIAVATAVAERLDDPTRVEIKWPNDVLIDGRKTSGILMESSAEGTHLAFAVLGIGVNLNVDRASFPDEFRPLATSLASESNRPVDRIAFARSLFEHLEILLDAHAESGFEGLRPRFDAFFRMRGRPITIDEIGGDRIEGVARGIAPNGALEVECTSGPRRGESLRVLAGDVTLAKPQPNADDSPASRGRSGGEGPSAPGGEEATSRE